MIFVSFSIEKIIIPCCYCAPFVPPNFSFSSTTLCEFWLAKLFLSIASSPASFVSNWSLPSSSNHSSHRLPVLLLAFLSVLLRTVSICIWSWLLFHTWPNQLSHLYFMYLTIFSLLIAFSSSSFVLSLHSQFAFCVGQNILLSIFLSNTNNFC